MKLHPLRWLGGLLLLAYLLPIRPAAAQQWLHDDGSRTNKSMFRILDEWPDPNDYRNAAGQPGPRYWQQQADYRIQVALLDLYMVFTMSWLGLTFADGLSSTPISISGRRK